MLSPSAYTAVSSVGPAKVYRANMEREDRIRAAADTHGSEKYDSVTLSAPSQSKFHLALVGRLTQEVRTATTTGDIAALRRQVAEHQYTPDPAAIARRIMFLEDRSHE